MIFLRTVERLGDVENGSGYPFAVPPLRELRRLDFTAPVTFFVGENGAGKSTLLEAIALRGRLPSVTPQPLEHEAALVPIHPLARSLRLTWQPRTHLGFFLRVEDFFTLCRDLKRRNEMMEAVSAFADDPESHASPRPQKQPFDSRGVEDLPALSHGESFLKFLQSRCRPSGLHVLDEPEAALSPQRQIVLLKMIRRLVQENAQFIIATHSPLLLAFPGAQILCFDSGTIKEVAYEELPHVTLTRAFLEKPERFLDDL
jgi:predicted ATPase